MSEEQKPTTEDAAKFEEKRKPDWHIVSFGERTAVFLRGMNVTENIDNLKLTLTGHGEEQRLKLEGTFRGVASAEIMAHAPMSATRNPPPDPVVVEDRGPWWRFW